MPLYLDVLGQPVSIVALAVTGVVVGFVAGMFGVGGGFLLTPMLSAVLGVPLPIAVGSGLCQMVGTSTTAWLRHRRLGQGEIRFDLLMLPGALLGVRAGSDTLAALASLGTVVVHGHRLEIVRLVVDAAYVALLAGAAAMFWRRLPSSSGEPGRAQPGPLARVRFGPSIELPRVSMAVSGVLVAEMGLALGFLSGLLGIGGGVALMPLLVYGFGLPIRHAAGTGIVLLACTAATGTVTHALGGRVHLGLSVVLLIGSTVAAQLGALATRRVSTSQLRRGFAIVIVASAAAVAWDLVRRVV